MAASTPESRDDEIGLALFDYRLGLRWQELTYLIILSLIGTGCLLGGWRGALFGLPLLGAAVLIAYLARGRCVQIDRNELRYLRRGRLAWHITETDLAYCRLYDDALTLQLHSGQRYRITRFQPGDADVLHEQLRRWVRSGFYKRENELYDTSDGNTGGLS